MTVDPSELWTQKPLLGCQRGRGANLALDLAFAEHHRVEAGGDTKEVRRDVLLVSGVEGTREPAGDDGRLFEQRTPQRGLARPRISHRGVELRPVARGERDRFLDHGLPTEGPEDGADASLVEGGLPPIVDRGRLVGQADGEQALGVRAFSLLVIRGRPVRRDRRGARAACECA